MSTIRGWSVYHKKNYSSPPHRPATRPQQRTQRRGIEPQSCSCRDLHREVVGWHHPLGLITWGDGWFSKEEWAQASHSSENYTTPHSANLSIPNTIFLCCLISKDMEVYQQLILKAANLESVQKCKTLNHLLHQCQVKALVHDPVNHPFQWRAFRQGRTCTGFM